LSSGDAARFRDDEYGKAETSSNTRNESAHKGDKDKEKKEKEKEDRDEGEIVNMSIVNFPLIFSFSSAETIKVFDGNCSLRRRIFRAITVPRTCTLEQLLTTALRAFHIAREPSVS
jgi:hypothetical protein